VDTLKMAGFEKIQKTESIEKQGKSKDI